MRDEQAARKAADLHWLAEGFAYAKQIEAKASSSTGRPTRTSTTRTTRRTRTTSTPIPTT
jgi:hypothetical protein